MRVAAMLHSSRQLKHVVTLAILVNLTTSSCFPVTLGDVVQDVERQQASDTTSPLFTPEIAEVTAIPIKSPISPWPSPLPRTMLPTSSPSVSASMLPTPSISASASAVATPQFVATPEVTRTPQPQFESLPKATDAPPVAEESMQIAPTPAPWDITYSQAPPSLIPLVEFPTPSKTVQNGTNADNLVGVPACLSGDTRVRLQNGNVIGIGSLRVGDFVQDETGYSPVLMFTHADSIARSLMIVLTANNDETVALSLGHYVPTHRNGLVPAAKLRVGDMLVDGSIIARLTREWRVGLYNPQTSTGTIRPVNAPTVSTYTTAVSVSVAHAALAPLRALFNCGSGLTVGWLSRYCIGEHVSCGGRIFNTMQRAFEIRSILYALRMLS